jgi:RimK family alpha-L-glutamate ligase
MGDFFVVAHRATPTNTRLGTVVTPARALARLRRGDVALGRLDVLRSLDGIEPGLWALGRLGDLGVRVLNGRPALVKAHDKLETAAALDGAGVPHPRTVHVAPWLPAPKLEPPLVLKPRFGSWGLDVVRCDTNDDVELTLAELGSRHWFEAAGGLAQELIEPRGFDLRVIVCRGAVVGAVRRVAPEGEWRTNVALGGRREPVRPPDDACELALAAADAIGGTLVGVDLLPDGTGGWVVIEVNGAVDFTSAYSLDGDVFATVRSALLSAVSVPVLAAV